MDGDGTYFETVIFEGKPVHVRRLRTGDENAPYDPILSADWRSADPLNKQEMDRLHVFVRDHWDKGERPPRSGASLNTSIDW